MPRKYNQWLIPKFSDIGRGSCLTPERALRMQIRLDLTNQEKDLLLEMLYNQEAALVQDFGHLRKVHPEVAPPQKIQTIEYKAQQSLGFSLLRVLIPTVIEMLKDRLWFSILEYCKGLYRNQQFLIKKLEKVEYRLINTATDMNKVTIRDTNILLSLDDFAENFARY